jgi:hypothetical protein
MTAKEWIINDWGEEWLSKEWQAGDVIDALQQFAALKVSEATKEMYQFVEWIGANANMLYYPNSRDRWLLSRVVMSENPSVEYDEYTTAELFEYWKQNIRK